MPMLITILVIGLFIALGFVFISGKGSFLIAGYNTMSKEEKEMYDTVSLCKFMGKMMFTLSFSMLLWLLSDVYKMNWLFIVGLVFFIGTLVFMLIYTNTGNRFKK